MAKTIEIQIQKLPGGAGLPLPAYQSVGSAAMDLHAAVEESVMLQPGETTLIPCGFAMALPPGYEAQIRPRSGLASKFSVIIPNSPGTIDPDYRGEVKVPLLNLGKEPFPIHRGMRIAQLLIAPFLQVKWLETTQLPQTERGAGGFGHTGQ
jgi:dUTP pyrophosphatase